VESQGIVGELDALPSFKKASPSLGNSRASGEDRDFKRIESPPSVGSDHSPSMQDNSICWETESC
jgi:hypothetical protein